VDQTRRSGASWTDIGQSMGVTKRAARKRFVPSTPVDAGEMATGDGFDRFTERAKPLHPRRPGGGPGARERRHHQRPPAAGAPGRALGAEDQSGVAMLAAAAGERPPI